MTQRTVEPRWRTRREARKLVDKNEAMEFLGDIDDYLEPEEGADAALVEAAAEEIAEIADAALRRARRRGRNTITREDVAQANEQHQRRERSWNWY